LRRHFQDFVDQVAGVRGPPESDIEEREYLTRLVCCFGSEWPPHCLVEVFLGIFDAVESGCDSAQVQRGCLLVLNCVAELEPTLAVVELPE
jgi:hypothetical protein